jgi:hypothetical protein
VSKGPPNSPPSKVRRGYVLIPAGILASALTGGGAGWASGRNTPPAAVVAAAPVQPQVCEDLGAAVRTLQGEVAGLKQKDHDREEREKTLREFEERLRGLQPQAGPGPLKR